MLSHFLAYLLSIAYPKNINTVSPGTAVLVHAKAENQLEWRFEQIKFESVLYPCADTVGVFAVGKAQIPRARRNRGTKEGIGQDEAGDTAV